MDLFIENCFRIGNISVVGNLGIESHAEILETNIVFSILFVYGSKD